MLTISNELALAFEVSTLGRWKAEIAAELRDQYPEAATKFPGVKLDDWVRSAMGTIRSLGATTRADIALFAVTLFAVSETDADDDDATDFVAIMISESPLPAKMALLRKAFPSPSE